MSQGACSLGPAPGILGLVVEFLFWEGRPGRLRPGSSRGCWGMSVRNFGEGGASSAGRRGAGEGSLGWAGKPGEPRVLQVGGGEHAQMRCLRGGRRGWKGLRGREQRGACSVSPGSGSRAAGGEVSMLRVLPEMGASGICSLRAEQDSWCCGLRGADGVSPFPHISFSLR